ncbi:omwaprin-a-like isoform X2 [Pleurodeles waltl]|uniref:omwaprin-a-like isoform X2 n=1 Tax=Pleurodeles waltl TaxID=8319 RepID=UPI0037099387
MMKTSVTILLLAALLGLCETLPVEGGGSPAVNPKPGRCQNITPVLCFAPDLNNCESDGDCPRDQKCCNLPCGYGCTDPQTD